MLLLQWHIVIHFILISVFVLRVNTMSALSVVCEREHLPVLVFKSMNKMQL